MKRKLILFISVLFLMLNLAGAKIIEVPEAVGGVGLIAGGTPVVGGCNDTLKDSDTTTTGATYPLGEYSNQQYLATRFQAGSAYTLCKVVMRMAINAGSPTGNLTAYIYSDTTGPHPNAIFGVDGTSDTVDITTVGATEEDVTFTGFEAALVSGDQYWIVIHTDTVSAIANLYLARGAYSASLYVDKSDSPISWVLKANGALKYKTYD